MFHILSVFSKRIFLCSSYVFFTLIFLPSFRLYHYFSSTWWYGRHLSNSGTYSSFVYYFASVFIILLFSLLVVCFRVPYLKYFGPVSCSELKLLGLELQVMISVTLSATWQQFVTTGECGSGPPSVASFRNTELWTKNACFQRLSAFRGEQTSSPPYPRGYAASVCSERQLLSPQPSPVAVVHALSQFSVHATGPVCPYSLITKFS
jgi:hypothetical protein